MHESFPRFSVSYYGIQSLNVTTVFFFFFQSDPIASSSILVNPSNVHSLVTVKLTKDNYLLWKTQIVPYLRGQRLFGFVDGTISPPPPPPTIPNLGADTSNSTTPEITNPKYTSWFNQDQIVLSTIVSSLSESILGQMVGLSTSREVWIALERMFSSHSSARVIQTRQFLALKKKGNLSISDYYQKMKSFSDTLVAIGQSLQAHEFTTYLLGGLDSSYDAIVTSISTQIYKMSFEEMFNHLLAFELWIEQHQLLSKPRLVKQMWLLKMMDVREVADPISNHALHNSSNLTASTPTLEAVDRWGRFTH
ncbi:hypothetical protein Pint_17046 [Pistacia integerrima]|uniref:Uncharacterized protein n=1 Tax=Pistacia integerrima TaxID=434235 RepID=A0ACC0ZG88_9ROSI|nr:hypothetical protein Pint_17046 [Pistacia integerrima]